MPEVITNNLDLWTSALLTRSTAGRGTNGKLEAYGIKKLRGLILELAVRGKLVPQDPRDEPASTQLDKMAESQARLIVEGVIKTQPQLAEIEDEKKPFEIPDRWVWLRLGELGYTQTGGTPSKTNPSNFGNDIPFIKPGDIYPNYVDYGNEGLSHEGQLELGRIAPANSILMVCIGTIGKCNSIDRPCAFNQQINSITPYIPITGYLLKAISSNYFQSEAWQQSSSTTIAILNKGKWNDIIVPIPPIREQHRIVAKVDELMAMCDQLEQRQTDNIEAHQTLVENLLGTLTNVESQQELNDAWNRIADHFDTLFTTEQSIDQFKQTILQLAVMGKLVPQDPSDEPASVLLEKVTAEKQRLIKAKEIQQARKLPAINADAMPFRLPTKWQWAHVWDVAKVITSGSRDWAKYYSDNGAIFVTMGNLSRGDYKLRLDSIRYVSPPEDGEGSRTLLEANDLLISITGDVGNLGLIPDDFGEAYINQHTCLLRFMPYCQNRYFPELLRSPWAKYQFDAPQRGVKNSFRLSDVGEMIIPIPPLAEQHRIVAKVNELIALCDALKARLAAAQTTQIHLADTIVEQAVV